MSSSSAAAGKSLKMVLFLGSCRQGRLGERVAKFMKKQIELLNHQVTIFDPVVMPFPLLERPIFFYKDRADAPSWMVEAEKAVKEADAIIVVSAEYNHCIPPALSNMLDHFGASCYSYKPSAIVCYSAGQYGGMRAAMQLRAMLGELGCISVSNIFGLPSVQKSLDEEGKPLNDHMESGAKRILTELEWFAWAMKNHRDQFGLPKK